MALKDTAIDRIKEPSTWAGIGLVVQGLFLLFATKGGDANAWATIGAGFSAIFLAEK